MIKKSALATKPIYMSTLDNSNVQALTQNMIIHLSFRVTLKIRLQHIKKRKKNYNISKII